MKSSVMLIAVTFAVTQINAWSINGHLYIASIAERVLEKESPNSLKEANTMLSYLDRFSQTPEAGKDWTSREEDHAFVECATFTDDWKYRGEAWQGQFHYVNIPFISEGDESDYDIRYKSKNITDGTEQIIAWLSGKQGNDYRDGYIFTYLMSKFNGNEYVAKSYALRMLIHQMGDLAQPLHSTTRYNSDSPRGDAGGNGFKLKRRYGVKSLHSLWDKVLYAERSNIRRPFTSETWDKFSISVTRIMAMNAEAVANPKVYQNTDIDVWAQEAYEIGITLYDGLEQNQPVPQEYIDKHLDTAYSQILKGGYRLAYILDYIFNDLQPTIES